MDDWATLIEDDLSWREAELTSLKVMKLHTARKWSSKIWMNIWSMKMQQ